MRAGTWDGARTLDNVRVTVNGTVRPVKSVTIRSGMRDGHPLGDSSAWCVESTIGWEDPRDVALDAPHNFGPKSTPEGFVEATPWLPKPGDTVIIETGDGALGQWWVQHRGVIDDTSGSFADGTAQSETIDRIDELAGPVSMWAVLSRNAPLTTGDPFRQVGMTSNFLIDRMLRRSHDASGVVQTGWHATPPETWQTVGSATGQGSLVGEVGLVTVADRKSSPGQGPLWYTTPYGVAPSDYTARYNFRGPASDPVLSLGILNAGTGAGSISVVDDAGIGFRVTYNRATGNVGVSVMGTLPWPTWSVPLGSNRRVAVYFKRTGATSQSVILRLADGTESSWTGDAAGVPSGWAATRVHVDTEIPLGWWIVETGKTAGQRWDTLNHVPTARLRVGDHGFMTASRDIYLDDAAQWLQDQIDAECSTMWLDEDGVWQYAGRDVLEAQTPAQTVTTSSGAIDDVQWETRGRRLTRNLSLKYLQPQIYARANGAQSQTLWEGSASDLAPGEEDVIMATTPDDEDWLGVDEVPHHVKEWGKPWDYYTVGSTYGGTQYVAASSNDAAWAQFLNCSMTYINARAYEITFGPWPSMSGAHRVNSKCPPDGAGGNANADRTALILRGRAKAVWRDVENVTTVNASGRGTYTHDVGWRVQNLTGTGALNTLRTWLTGVLGGDPTPVVTSTLAHDPRRQIGDLIRIQDDDITGLDFNQLVSGRTITISASAFTDTITGRVTLVRATPAPGSRPLPSGHTALTPASNWTRKA